MTQQLHQQIHEQVSAQRRRQNVGLLRIYNYYRTAFGTTLLFIFTSVPSPHGLGTLNPDMFFLTTGYYILVNILFTGACLILPQRTLDRQLLGFFIVVADSLALILLMHFSGGISSGLGAFVIVAVSAGSIFVNQRVATAIPAVTTIAVLYEELYLSLIPDASLPDYFQAGLLGALYFIASFFIQNVSKRLLRSEFTALQRAAEVAGLERLNRLIVQRMHIGVLVLDAIGHISLINDTARQLLGLNPSSQTTPQLPKPLHDSWMRWRKNPQEPDPLWYALDATEVLVNFNQFVGNTEQETLIFIENNAELQRRAHELKLVTLGQFSTGIAHEIRNPLSAISHAAQLLAESSLQQPDRHLTDIIQTHSRRLSDIVENTLEFSRRHPPESQRLHLLKWLERFRDQFRETHMQPVEIEISEMKPDVFVNIDPRQLDQILTNLMMNGIRHSEKKTGHPWVCLEISVAADNSPCLSVIDKGPGVPIDQRLHIFEPFFTTEDAGTGLGLYISRELCEANHVRLSYLNAETGGSCFCLNFPSPKSTASHG